VNNLKNKIIGISGTAKTGKDTFYKLLKPRLEKLGIKTERVSLADYLRSELDGLIKKDFGIDVWKCSAEEKELIRPLLVSYADIKRFQSEGTYYTSKAQKRIDGLIESGIVPCITDIRYAKYPDDEIFWLKKNNGCLVHITKYIEKVEIGMYGNRVRRYYPPAPNINEKENDPKLKEAADFKFEWAHVNRPDLIKSVCGNYVDEFVHWFLK
jgi:hypothetical protein